MNGIRDVVRWLGTNMLFWVSLPFAAIIAFHGFAGRQSPVIERYKDEVRFVPQGYYDRLDALIRAGRLVESPSGTLTFTPANEGERAFAARSWLVNDVRSYNESRSGPLASVFPATPGQPPGRVEREQYATFLPQPRWRGRVTYRLADEGFATLESNGAARIITMPAVEELRGKSGRWKKDAFLVDAKAQRHWELTDRDPPGSARSAQSWNVRIRGASLLHEVRFFGRQDVIATLARDARLAEAGVRDLALNGRPLAVWIPAERGRQTRRIRLEDGDVLSFVERGRRRRVVFHRVQEGTAPPFAVLSSLAFTEKEPERRVGASENVFVRRTFEAAEEFHRNALLDSPDFDFDVELALDRNLEEALTPELESFVRGVRAPGRDPSMQAAVTVLRESTGEVLAIPSVPYTKTAEPANLNLMAHSPGSAWKVPLVAAALSVYPGLSEFRLRFGVNGFSPRAAYVPLASRSIDGLPPEPVRVLGSEVESFEEVTPGTLREVDLPSAIAHSSNVFIVSLAFLATVPPGRDAALASALRDHAKFGPGAWDFERRPILSNHPLFAAGSRMGNLPASPLAQALVEVFDLDPWIGSAQYDSSVWRDLEPVLRTAGSSRRAAAFRHAFRAPGVAPDEVGMGLDLIKDASDLRDEWISWCLGQGNNRWSNVELAEAYARVFSRRRVEARFVAVHGTPPPWPEIPSLKAIPDAAYRRFLSGLERSIEEGTASGLSAVRQRLAARGLELYAKTGTPMRNRGLGQGHVVCVVERASQGRRRADRLVFVYHVRGRSVASSGDAVELARRSLETALRAAGWLESEDRPS